MRLALTSVFILLTISFTSPLKAKDNKDLIKANWYYEHYAYHEAIPFFEKVLANEASSEVYGRLGDCYRFTGEHQKAGDNYAKAVHMKGCKPSLKLRYGQFLMQQMQYDSAKTWIQEYRQTYLTDRRAANLIEACDTAPIMLRASPAGEIKLLDFNTDGSEFAPTFWKGKLVFTADTIINLKKKTSKWSGKPFYNMYSVPCDDNGNCSNALEQVGQKKNINIKFHDGPATFNAAGDTMYFTRTRYLDKGIIKNSVSNEEGTVLLEIMIASDYDEGSRQFSKVTSFPFNNATYSVGHPAISPDGKTLVFSSPMHKGAGGSDLYMCHRNAKGKWLKPENLGNIVNTEGEEVFPFWGDDSTLYFSSDGHVGLGGLDIYVTHWDRNTNTFTVPENAGTPLNSPYDDISLAIHPYEPGAYFSSNRPAEKGSDNIYYYRKK